MQHINDVILQELTTHGDQRGFFREILKSSTDIFRDGSFGQFSHSLMERDVVKAWHYHHRQTDWWYIASGEIEAVLFDNREKSNTKKNIMKFQMGAENPLCVRIPPGVLHGLKVISDTANLLYITSHEYDPGDEGRVPYNSELVPHHWGQNITVSENDCRFFEPSFPLA